MADEVEGALEQLTERLVQLADTIAENSGPAAKVAWDVSMVALRIEAIAYIAVSVILCFAAFLYFRLAVRPVWKWANAKYAKDKQEPGYFFLAGLAWLPFICVLLGACINLLSVQNWVTAFSPESGLALRVLNGL